MAEVSYKIKNTYSEQNLTATDIEQLDITPLGKNSFHILKGHDSIDVHIESADHSNKRYAVLINGNKYDVEIMDEYDQLIDKMGLNVTADNKVSDITAPMPGLILDIMVKEGDQVSKGDALLILEAMKMENVIKSVGDGVVKNVNGTKGKAVDKGELIIELEK